MCDFKIVVNKSITRGFTKNKKKLSNEVFVFYKNKTTTIFSGE